MDWAGHLLLFVVGVVAGTLNVIAGGGSFLTLPVLIFLGLPPTIANATNRVGILIQNVGAVWSFRRSGYFEQGSLLWAALPATLGSAVGTWIALVLAEDLFQRLLAILMVVLSIWTLLAPQPKPRAAPSPAAALPAGDAAAPRGLRLWLLAGSFFLVGIYGGFVQAGVGFLILAATTAIGLDLVRGNAVKVLAILWLTALSLALFVWQDKVVWIPGLVLAAGNLLGGLAGARLTVLKGHRWVRQVVLVTVILFAIQLWFES